MAESRLANCTFCPLSPVGPSDWVYTLWRFRERTLRQGAQKKVAEPERATVGFGGVYLQAFRFRRSDAAT